MCDICTGIFMDYGHCVIPPVIYMCMALLLTSDTVDANVSDVKAGALSL